jgi:hypothetical protein
VPGKVYFVTFQLNNEPHGARLLKPAGLLGFVTLAVRFLARCQTDNTVTVKDSLERGKTDGLPTITTAACELFYADCRSGHGGLRAGTGRFSELMKGCFLINWTSENCFKVQIVPPRLFFHTRPLLKLAMGFFRALAATRVGLDLFDVPHSSIELAHSSVVR